MSADEGVRIINQQRPVDLIEIAQRDKRISPESKPGETSFKEMFSRELADSRDIAFSRHAHERLFSRGAGLSEDDLNHLADAVDRAQAKGSRETLILSDSNAYVVSVKNRTVITVFDRDNLREGVVTSIDSAVII